MLTPVEKLYDYDIDTNMRFQKTLFIWRLFLNRLFDKDENFAKKFLWMFSDAIVFELPGKTNKDKIELMRKSLENAIRRNLSYENTIIKTVHDHFVNTIWYNIISSTPNWIKENANFNDINTILPLIDHNIQILINWSDEFISKFISDCLVNPRKLFIELSKDYKHILNIIKSELWEDMNALTIVEKHFHTWSEISSSNIKILPEQISTEISAKFWLYWTDSLLATFLIENWLTNNKFSNFDIFIILHRMRLYSDKMFKFFKYITSTNIKNIYQQNISTKIMPYYNPWKKKYEYMIDINNESNQSIIFEDICLQLFMSIICKWDLELIWLDELIFRIEQIYSVIDENDIDDIKPINILIYTPTELLPEEKQSFIQWLTAISSNIPNFDKNISSFIHKHILLKILNNDINIYKKNDILILENTLWTEKDKWFRIIMQNHTIKLIMYDIKDWWLNPKVQINCVRWEKDDQYFVNEQIPTCISKIRTIINCYIQTAMWYENKHFFDWLNTELWILNHEIIPRSWILEKLWTIEKAPQYKINIDKFNFLKDPEQRDIFVNYISEAIIWILHYIHRKHSINNKAFLNYLIWRFALSDFQWKSANELKNRFKPKNSWIKFSLPNKYEGINDKFINIIPEITKVFDIILILPSHSIELSNNTPISNIGLSLPKLIFDSKPGHEIQHLLRLSQPNIWLDIVDSEIQYIKDNINYVSWLSEFEYFINRLNHAQWLWDWLIFLKAFDMNKISDYLKNCWNKEIQKNRINKAINWLLWKPISIWDDLWLFEIIEFAFQFKIKIEKNKVDNYLQKVDMNDYIARFMWYNQDIIKTYLNDSRYLPYISLIQKYLNNTIKRTILSLTEYIDKQVSIKWIDTIPEIVRNKSVSKIIESYIITLRTCFEFGKKYKSYDESFNQKIRDCIRKIIDFYQGSFDLYTFTYDLDLIHIKPDEQEMFFTNISNLREIYSFASRLNMKFTKNKDRSYLNTLAEKFFPNQSADNMIVTEYQKKIEPQNNEQVVQHTKETINDDLGKIKKDLIPQKTVQTIRKLTILKHLKILESWGYSQEQVEQIFIDHTEQMKLFILHIFKKKQLHTYINYLLKDNIIFKSTIIKKFFLQLPKEEFWEKITLKFDSHYANSSSSLNNFNYNLLEQFWLVNHVRIKIFKRKNVQNPDSINFVNEILWIMPNYISMIREYIVSFSKYHHNVEISRREKLLHN